MLSQFRRLITHTGLWLPLTLLAIGLLTYLLGNTGVSTAAFLIGIGSGLGWCVHWLFTRQSLTKPLARLVATGEALITKDSLALTNALTALAQGNLTAHAALETQPLLLTGSREVDQLPNWLNTIIVQLQDSAKEFNAVTDEPCQRLFYVGADAYLEGCTCGEIMGQSLKGQGQVSIIIGSRSQTSHQLRRKGFENTLREKYPGVQILETAENQDSAEICYSLTFEFRKTLSEPAGIYVAEGGSPFGAARALFETDFTGRIKLVTHDLVDETMQYLMQGVVTATVGQDPFAQGHDPVIQLLITSLRVGNRPRRACSTAPDVVTPKNYQQFWDASRSVIEFEGVAKQRAIPLEVRRPLRIAVLGRDESHFWDPVHAGVLAAATEMRTNNATVEWLLPEGGNTQPNLAVRGQAIDQLVKAGYDAIITDVFDSGLVAHINRAVASGIPIATFNSEPSSLRGHRDACPTYPTPDDCQQRSSHLIRIFKDCHATDCHNDPTSSTRYYPTNHQRDDNHRFGRTNEPRDWRCCQRRAGTSQRHRQGFASHLAHQYSNSTSCQECTIGHND